MTLPVPPLDARTTHDLVADAKAAVRTLVPQWAGIDGPDPGTALVEACAAMAASLVRRVNQAPDKERLAVLADLRVWPRPASPARTEVAFTLTVARAAPVEIPSGTQVASEPSGGAGVAFATTQPALLYSCTLLAGGLFRGEHYIPDRQTFTGGLAALAAGSSLTQSTALLAVLSGTVPDTQITLDFQTAADLSALGLASGDWAWEVWAGTRWDACDLVEDTTAGLTRRGHAILRIPASHAPTAVELNRGTDAVPQQWRAEDVGLLRCRYTGSAVFTVRPTAMTLSTEMSVLVPVVQAAVVDGAVIGVSTGLPGQRFALPSPPLLLEGRITAETTVPGQPTRLWEHRGSLAPAGPDDAVFWIDPATGEAVFGVRALAPDGVRRHGAIPPEGAQVRITRYLTGGGSGGNVPARSVTVLRNPLPPISRVSNPSAATGGADAEALDAFADRVPLGWSGARRVVTAADMEDAVRSTPTGVLRVRHVAAGKGGLLTPFHDVAFWTPASSTVRFTNPGKTAVGVPAGTRVATAATAATAGGAAVVFTTTYPVSVDGGGICDVNVTQQKTVAAGTPIVGGISDGTPGQKARLTHYPITGPKPSITVLTPNSGAQLWRVVDTFAASTSADQHVMVDATTGEVCFGIGEYGAIPVSGSTFAVGTAYQATVGAAGNVPVGAITQCDPALGLTVVNNVPAQSGANGSSVVTPSTGPYGLLVVPALAAGPGSRLNYNDLVPSATLRDNVARVLRPLMPPGTTVGVHAPGYQGVGVDATVVPADSLLPSERAALRKSAQDALHAYFNPISGGPDGAGWPFGRPVHLGDAYGVLDRLPGVAEVSSLSLYPVSPVTGERGRPVDRIDVTDLSTVFSVGHTVTVPDPAATPAPAARKAAS
jgi:Baseplate J-like protein